MSASAAYRPAIGWAQRSPTSAAVNDNLGPLLTLVGIRAPAQLPGILGALRGISPVQEGTQSSIGGTKGLLREKPTPEEADQLAQNPPFQVAFKKNPNKTLEILEWTNKITRD